MEVTVSAQTNDSIAGCCSYCGRENSEGLAECSGCGMPLTSAPAEVASQPKKKSRTAGVLLAFAFGPLGLFYVSVPAGLIMVLLLVPVYLATRGGLLFHFLARIICAVWAYMELTEQDEASKPKLLANALLDEAARLESVDRAQAICAYEEIVRLYPDTPAGKQAVRNIETLRRPVTS